ncbi:MAG: aldehyde dehydrogenase [Phycisphaerae bacterium]|nr:aldehyde dehydrogenase [Phycisphaerae bacterium]|tara:strand:- start:4231 stop:5106 length:876 start_codon:yes stop_codon:yes gene_type:complete
MNARLDVIKTCKLFIGGAFPRTESGRSRPILDGDDRVIAHACVASRKDLRNAVEAARKAAPAWLNASAYLRGQILYRMAEMLEGRRDEFANAIATTTDATPAKARKEVEQSVDRLVRFAGWSDKFQQILGCQNPVNGPYYNFTVPQPTGITGVLAPSTPSLLALVTLIAGPLCAGCTVVAVASEDTPLPAVLLSEICATSDVPAGTVNILTGQRAELIEPMASHREIAAINGANLTPSQRTGIQSAAADNLKRVHLAKHTEDQWEDDELVASPWNIEPFVESKTIWHPSAT